MRFKVYLANDECGYWWMEDVNKTGDQPLPEGSGPFPSSDHKVMAVWRALTSHRHMPQAFIDKAPTKYCIERED